MLGGISLTAHTCTELPATAQNKGVLAHAQSNRARNSAAQIEKPPLTSQTNRDNISDSPISRPNRGYDPWKQDERKGLRDSLQRDATQSRANIAVVNGSVPGRVP